MAADARVADALAVLAPDAGLELRDVLAEFLGAFRALIDRFA